MTYKDDLLGGHGAKSSAVEDLLLVAKDLLEICRWKCSPTDEVVRADGITNEQVMVAAMKTIKRVEFERTKKPRAKASSFDLAGHILATAVMQNKLARDQVIVVRGD